MIRLLKAVGLAQDDCPVPEKTLFADSDLRMHLKRQQQKPRDALQAYDPDKLLLTAESDLIEYVGGLGRVEEVVLLRDEIYALEPGEVTMETRERFDLAFGVTHRRVTRWTLVVPFKGQPDLFSMRASTYSLSPPRAEIIGYELHIHYYSNHGQSTAEQIRAFFDGELNAIEKQLSYINSDIAAHNRAIEQEVPGLVSTRRAKHLADKQLQSNLGYPIKQRADSSAFAVPLSRRRLTPQRPTPPQPKEQAFAPEPVLADGDYEDALAALLNSRNAIERAPSTAAKLNEEEIRDLLLINLNSRFEGKAAREVFNGRGKTDILIRVDDRNIFIGECKFWGGPKRLTAAVDQLLSYATWRDTKAALLIFIKGGDFTAITEKAVRTITEHPNFKRRGRHATEDRHDFVLHAESDTNREIKLALMLFAIVDTKKSPS
jgi:hypothetical protein